MMLIFAGKDVLNDSNTYECNEFIQIVFLMLYVFSGHCWIFVANIFILITSVHIWLLLVDFFLFSCLPSCKRPRINCFKKVIHFLQFCVSAKSRDLPFRKPKPCL